MSLRDFSGPHFSKPEPELRENEIKIYKTESGKVQTSQLKLHHCVQEIHQRFFFVPFLISRISAKFGNARQNAGFFDRDYCH